MKGALETGDAYVHCLSSHRDKLSQWRGYAANGSGVSIGMNPSVRLDIMRGQHSLLIRQVNWADTFSELPITDQGFLEKLIVSDGPPIGMFA